MVKSAWWQELSDDELRVRLGQHNAAGTRDVDALVDDRDDEVAASLISGILGAEG